MPKYKLHTSKYYRGFTIVELLIVIVIIAILAIISIVSYNGVTARAKTASAQSTAATLIKKAEVYKSIMAITRQREAILIQTEAPR